MGGKNSKKNQNDENSWLSFEEDNNVPQKKGNSSPPQKNTQVESFARRKNVTDVVEPGQEFEAQANSAEVVRTTSCDGDPGTQEITLSFDVVPEKVLQALRTSPVLLPSSPEKDVSDAATKNIPDNYAKPIVRKDDVIEPTPVEKGESAEMFHCDSVSTDAYRIDGSSVKRDSPSTGLLSVAKTGSNGHSDRRSLVGIGDVSMMTPTDNIDRSEHVVCSMGNINNVGSAEACGRGEIFQNSIELNETNGESVKVNMKLTGNNPAFASHTCDKRDIENANLRAVPKCADSNSDNIEKIATVQSNTYQTSNVHVSLETNDDKNDVDAVSFAFKESVSLGSFAHIGSPEKDQGSTGHVSNAFHASADHEITPVTDNNTIGSSDFKDDFVLTGLNTSIIGRGFGKDINSSPKSSSGSSIRLGGELHTRVETGRESITLTDGRGNSGHSGKYDCTNFKFDGCGVHKRVLEEDICGKFNGNQSSRGLNVKVDLENVRNVHPALEEGDCYGRGDVCYYLEEGKKDANESDDAYADFCFEDYAKRTSKTDEILEDNDDGDAYTDFCYKDYTKRNSKTDETQKGEDNDAFTDFYFKDHAKHNSKTAKIQGENEDDEEEGEGDEDEEEEEWCWFNSCTPQRDSFVDKELREEGTAGEKEKKKEKEDQQDGNGGGDDGNHNANDMEHQQEKKRGKDYGFDDYDYTGVNYIVEDDMENEENNKGEDEEDENEEEEEDEEEEENEKEEEYDDEDGNNYEGEVAEKLKEKGEGKKNLEEDAIIYRWYDAEKKIGKDYGFDDHDYIGVDYIEEDDMEDEEDNEGEEVEGEEEEEDEEDEEDDEEEEGDVEEEEDEKEEEYDDEDSDNYNEVDDYLDDDDGELARSHDIKGHEANTSHSRNSSIYSGYYVENNAHSSASLTKPSWQVYDGRNGNLTRELFIDGRARHNKSFSESHFISRNPDDVSLPHLLSSESEAFDTDAFLVNGLSTRTTKDALLNFFEVISGGQVREITSLKEGKALVTMETPIKDIAKMKEKCGRRPLDGNKITITLASPHTSVLVSGLSYDTSHELVKLYFESSRSGGGPVDTVHFTGKEGQAVVVFNNAKDMEQVLARQEERPHVVDGEYLTVTVFHALLQNLDEDDTMGKVDSSPLHYSSEKFTATKQPSQTAKQRLRLAVDPDVMKFIHESFYLEDLLDLLEKRQCDLDWKAGSKHAFIQYGGNLEDNCISSLCIDEVQAFLGKFLQWHVPIEGDIWNTLKTGSMIEIYDYLGDDPPLLELFEGDSGFYLRVVSLKSDKDSYEEILQEALAQVCCLGRKRNYRTEKITDVPEERIQILRKTNFECNLQQEFEELTVRIDDESEEILFEGPEDEVTDAIARYCKVNAEITEKKLQLPRGVLDMLNSETALQALNDELSANKVDAVFFLEEDESTSRVVAAKILGISSEKLEKASDLINRLTAETALKIKERDLVLTTTPEWNHVCNEIEKDGTVVIRRDETGRTWLAGLSRDVEFSAKKLQLFIVERAAKISKKSFLCPSKQIKRYLREFGKSDLMAIQTQLEKYDITILDGQDGDNFIISGQGDGLNPARYMLDHLIQGLVTEKLELSRAGLRKFFFDGKPDKIAEKIEKDLKCVVRIEKTLAKIKTGRLSRKTALFEPESTESEDEEVTEDNSASSLVQQKSASFCVTIQGRNISWKAGNIAQEQADIVVSSQGACASSIRRAAGPRMRPVTPNPGEIDVSPGFQLPCTHVIHTYCSEWRGGCGETALRSIVRKSLGKSDELNGTSIAFPVIGTGNLQFPRSEASRIMLDETVTFCDNNPHSIVKDIRFVIFDQDQNLITAFQQEMNSLQLRRGSFAQPGTTVETQTWWKKIQVVEGNLTEQRVDAIINIIGKDMDLSRAGALSKAVARAAGKRVIQECEELGPQPVGSAVMTSGGNLPANNIIHLVPKSSDKQHLQACLEKCLHLAHSQGLHSIAIPAIGTGAYHMTPSESAILTFQALGNVSGTCSSFSKVKIVIFVKEMLETFVKEHKRVVHSAEQLLTSRTQATTTSTKKSYPPRGFSARRKSPESVSCKSASIVHISVTAADDKTARAALAALKEGFSECCTTQVIHDESVSQLSDRQVNRLLQSCKKRDIELKIEPTGNRVEVQGDANDVTAIVGEIWVELNERCKKVRNRENAKLLAGHVEWRYVLYGKTRRFSSTKNAKIEEAYTKKSPDVTVGICGDQFQLNFKDNTGIGSLSGEQIKISRKVLGRSEATGISLPSHWEAMPREANGNEITVHTVKLRPQSSEFQSVVRMFTKTMNSVNVKRVERIQNPLLYQAYQLRKQKMDKDNGGNNERQLFHGTAYKNVKKINSQGFNRNFSGLAHGTRLGKGVYFARDARYSLQFTPQSTDHSRYMYLARVLVGRYCQGDSKLVVPPSKHPSRPEILYDSVVDNTGNPGSFVVFTDSQCYPEYLIKF